MISYIVAMDENGTIGKNNQLPWRLPEDLKFFKKITMGHPIVMGRKTHESIGKPLAGRENIIITRNPHYVSENCKVFYSIQNFLDYERSCNQEFFIIGGAEIFKETFKYADRLYITKIHAEFEGDTFFPKFNLQDWELISIEKGIKNEQNPYDYEFCLYDRKKEKHQQ